jgi:hypothetical protein
MYRPGSTGHSRMHLVKLAWIAMVIAVVNVNSAPMTEEQEQNMPDFGNPKVAAKLKCSACRASALEFYDALKDLRSIRKKPTEFEITETMDRYFVEMCRRVVVCFVSIV